MNLVFEIPERPVDIATTTIPFPPFHHPNPARSPLIPREYQETSPKDSWVSAIPTQPKTPMRDGYP